MKPFKKIIAVFVFLFSALTINAQVFQEWAQRFNGPDSLFDTGSAIDVDGNVFVTGTTTVSSVNHIVTIKYNKAGVQQWAVTGVAGNGNAIALDNSGNAYVTGNTTINGVANFITIKYSSSGVQQWQSFFTDDAGAAFAIALDKSNNVYVTGNTEGRFPTTIKYNNTGVQQWVAVYSASTGAGTAVAMALDANNNVYIATWVTTTSSGTDFTTIKYNTNGTQQWASAFNGTANSNDTPRDIALDKNNNVYVTGTSIGTGSQFDVATVKYNNSGAQQWVQRFDGAANGTDDPQGGIAIDSKDNVIIAGLTQTVTVPFQFDMFTIQYDKNGHLKWIQTFNGPANESDAASALVVDNKDNIYITGTSTGVGSGFDYTTIKYSSIGELAWTQRYNGDGNGFDGARAIAIDSTGNVYVTGLSFGGATNFDIATVKYVDISNFFLRPNIGGDKKPCECYFSKDCGKGGHCNIVSANCGPQDKSVGVGKLDGRCSHPSLLRKLNNATHFLELWLLAYEKAGAAGGGVPDFALIKTAIDSFSLSKKMRSTVVEICLNIVALYAGPTSSPNIPPHKVGYFVLPSDSINPLTGSIRALPQEVLEVGKIVRQAFIAGLQTRSDEIFDEKMAEIRMKVPNYQSLGRCTFPHNHEHDFPFTDGVACLTEELKAILNSALSREGSNESL